MFAYGQSLRFPRIKAKRKLETIPIKRFKRPQGGFPSELGTQRWDFPMSLEPPSPGIIENLSSVSY
jgi:hypothetical protein